MIWYFFGIFSVVLKRKGDAIFKGAARLLPLTSTKKSSVRKF
tara:strand:+ start:251 stop:376 length:126 start_codon:yes stop_codon:yes gene_type:complete